MLKILIIVLLKLQCITACVSVSLKLQAINCNKGNLFTYSIYPGKAFSSHFQMHFQNTFFSSYSCIYNKAQKLFSNQKAPWVDCLLDASVFLYSVILETLPVHQISPLNTFVRMDNAFFPLCAGNRSTEEEMYTLSQSSVGISYFSNVHVRDTNFQQDYR